MPYQQPMSRFLLVTSVFSSTIFLVLTWLYVTGSPVNRVDVWLGELLHSLNDRHIVAIDASMDAVSFLGGNGLLVIAGIVAAYLFFCRLWTNLLIWVAVVGGAIVFNRLLKETFEVVRPVVGHTDRFEVSTGFPSGHAMVAMVTYGLLATLIAAGAHQRAVRVASIVGCAFLILAISFSRLYLSVHYLSDVLGGLAAGVAWLTFSVWLAGTVANRRQARAIRVDA
jgi:undecaprenyl-diphosphatase